MTDKLSDLKLLQGHIKTLIDARKRQESLSGKDYSQMTQKQVQKNGADLTWLGMDIEKAERQAHAAAVDCGLAAPRKLDQYDAIEFYPSAFHRYRWVPPKPRCML